MSPFVLPLVFLALVFAAIVWANERWGLLRCDAFGSAAAKWAGYVWLGLLFLVLGVLIVGSSLHPAGAEDLAKAPFYSLFGLHAILIVFLGGWWLLTGRPALRTYLNIPREGAGRAVLMGFAVGVGGWLLTLAMALTIGLILMQAGLIPKNPAPSPMIAWMAALPVWKKALIVFSAMTVEEAFFRGWLQKRVGLIASTTLFALAHSGLGQPLLLIGVGIISLVIGTAFYRTKNLIPGIVAHGVFDAVQLFVIIPVAFRLVGV